MKVNKEANLDLLLEHGWSNSGGTYSKDFETDSVAVFQLIINPVGVHDSDFIINSFIEADDLVDEDGYFGDESSLDVVVLIAEIKYMFDIGVLI